MTDKHETRTGGTEQEKSSWRWVFYVLVIVGFLLLPRGVIEIPVDIMSNLLEQTVEIVGHYYD